MMRWPNEQEAHVLRTVRVDRIGSVVGLTAYMALLLLTLASVAGAARPPVVFTTKAGDLTDEQLLAFLLLFGGIAAIVWVWTGVVTRRERQGKQ
jgi:hypothetical protein